MRTREQILLAIRDEHDYAAALEEFDSLVLSEPGTPAARRFEELVQLIDEYAIRRSRFVLPWRRRVATASPPRIDARRKLATAANR